MALRRFLLAVAGAAAFLVSPCPAQTIVPTYNTSTGNTLNAQGVVVLNPDGTSGGTPQPVTSIPTSGSVATANTFQSALAASPTRKGCAIYNTSVATEMVFLGSPGSATTATSIPVPAGGSFNCGSFQGIVLTDQISITSATAGSTFVVVRQ